MLVDEFPPPLQEVEVAYLLVAMSVLVIMLVLMFVALLQAVESQLDLAETIIRDMATMNPDRTGEILSLQNRAWRYHNHAGNKKAPPKGDQTTI